MHNGPPSSVSAFAPQQKSPADGSSCPVASPKPPPRSTSQPSSTISKMNPLNHMPNISQARASNQITPLPTSRTTSSIPRGGVEGNWEYPSPQQMYNALLRKGYDGTPADGVESMVEVHNFLNEGAWEEIEGWEARFSRGLGYGWRVCSRGEEGFIPERQAPDQQPRLMRFMGRPGDLTPKARLCGMLGQVWPSKFACVSTMDNKGFD